MPVRCERRRRAPVFVWSLAISSALILTYHAVEDGPPPLCIEPGVFRRQLDCMLDLAARAVTVRELVETLREGELTGPTVAITFDDAFASVTEAAQALLERGLTATVFAVARHLGGKNDWPSARAGGFESRVATAADLSELARAGFEIGSHGLAHAPLIGGPEELVRREVVDSKLVLEQAVATAVTSYAYPYGAGPSPLGKRIVEETYAAACTTTIRRVKPGADRYALPRVDAHYLRRPELVRRALSGSLDRYLAVRGLVSRSRRAVRKDYAAVEFGRFGGESLPE